MSVTSPAVAPVRFVRPSLLRRIGKGTWRFVRSSPLSAFWGVRTER